MKKLLLNFALVMFLTTSCFLSLAQTPISVTFKPGPEIGQDAEIDYTVDDCIPTGGSTIARYYNYGDIPEVSASAWTWHIYGCDAAYSRGLLKFTELSSIPSDAIIIAAELKLYGTSNGVGCNYYPGASHPYSNESFIQMVTSDWDENIVTWDTQPTTTTINQTSFSSSSTQYNHNFYNNSNELITMVQSMVSNPNNNFGFMIKLQNENIYRRITFASSENENSELWPELTIEYTIPCNSDFTYCKSSNSSLYTFNSLVPESQSMWFVNGKIKSYSPSFEYELPSGTNNICHYLIENTTGEMCSSCIDICTAQKSTSKDTKSSDEIKEILQNRFAYEENLDKNNLNVVVYPNPSSDEWNIKINSDQEEQITINLTDISGKSIKTENKYISKGENQITFDCKDLNSGIYLLVIAGKNKDQSYKLIKN